MLIILEIKWSYINEHKDHKILLSDFDFERMSYISETNFEEDIDELDLPL